MHCECMDSSQLQLTIFRKLELFIRSAIPSSSYF